MFCRFFLCLCIFSFHMVFVFCLLCFRLGLLCFYKWTCFGLDGCIRFMRCYVVLLMDVDNDDFRCWHVRVHNIPMTPLLVISWFKMKLNFQSIGVVGFIFGQRKKKQNSNFLFQCPISLWPTYAFPPPLLFWFLF